MKCRRCGNPLKEGDRFCSKCGARVFREPLSMSRKSRQAGNRKKSDNDGGMVFEYVPPEKFSWDTSDFPGEHMPTKDIDFNWNTFDDFHRKTDALKETRVHHDGDEIAFGAGSERTEEKEDREESAKGNTAAENLSVTGEETGIGTECEVPDEEAGTVSEDIDPEAPRECAEDGSIGDEGEKGEDQSEEKEKFTWNEPFQQPTPPAGAGQDEEPEDVMPESGISFEDEEDEEESNVDQFYTFNRKNAEFQQLLDQEYEKYRNSRFTPAEDREEIQEEVPEDEDIEDASEEAADAPEAEESRISEPETSENVQEEAAAAETPETPSAKENEKTEDRGTGQEEGRENTETAGAAENVRTAVPHREQPSEEKTTEETAGHAGNPQKKSGLRTVLTVILILAVIVAVLSAAALIAPESSIGHGIRSVLGISQSSSRPVPEKTDESTAAEDKTGLIQKEIKSGRKGKLTEVKYNAALKYDSALKYKDKDIEKSKVLKKNPVYEKTDSGVIHVDRALTGSVIGYSAEHIGKKNGGAVLEIGEYRQDGKNYYAWVSLNDRQKVFKIKDEKDRLNVVKVYDL